MPNNLESLTYTPTNKIYQTNRGVIAFGFPAKAGQLLREGAVVKLDSNGEILAVTAPADQPIGVVTKGNVDAGGNLVSFYNDDDQIVVSTHFTVVALGYNVAATLDTGDVVAATGYNTTENLTTYALAATGHRACGVVLRKNGAEIIVGLYATPLPIIL